MTPEDEMDTVIESTVEAVSGSVAKIIRSGAGGERDANTIRAATAGAVHAASELGMDLAAAARGAVRGVVLGTQDTGERVLEVVALASEALIVKTDERGEDVQATTRGAIQGAIEMAAEANLTAQELASAALRGALRGAETVGDDSVRSVREVADALIREFKQG